MILITENLSTLKIHKLTQEQYDRELAAGRIDENALYLTPDEKVDSINGKTGYVQLTASDVGAAIMVRYTAEISAQSDQWAESNGYYYQDIDVAGILESDYPIVGVNTGDDNATNVIFKKEFAKIFRIKTSENKITVWSTSQFSTAIPIQIQVVR